MWRDKPYHEERQEYIHAPHVHLRSGNTFYRSGSSPRRASGQSFQVFYFQQFHGADEVRTLLTCISHHPTAAACEEKAVTREKLKGRDSCLVFRVS